MELQQDFDKKMQDMQESMGKSLLKSVQSWNKSLYNSKKKMEEKRDKNGGNEVEKMQAQFDVVSYTY